MFKAIRISILLFLLLFVGLSTMLTQARSTDWNNSLWIKIYPINADGSSAATKYIEALKTSDFEGIEAFLERETERYSRAINRPVRIELGTEIDEQPPELGKQPGGLSVMFWSLKMRWWASPFLFRDRSLLTRGYAHLHGDSRPLRGVLVGASRLPCVCEWRSIWL